MKRINILGAEWEITKEDFNNDELKGKDRDGYCYNTARKIVVADFNTNEDWKNEDDKCKEEATRQILRHEIIHAYLYESGLGANTNTSECWAENEEMVDWMAIQFPKIYKTFMEAGAV